MSEKICGFVFVVICLFFNLGLLPCRSQGFVPSSDVLLPRDSLLEYGKLDNGFCYYVRKVDSLQKKIEIRFIVRAGFEQEEPNQLEAAHILEHLAARSTSRYPQLRKELEGRGLLLGVDYNAVTDYGKTEYIFTIPGSDPGLVDFCLELIQEWASGVINLDSINVEREKRIVSQERGMGRMSLGSSLDFIANAIGDGNHSGRILQDKQANGDKIERGALIKFRDTWYRPDLEAIIIVGDLDPGIISSKVKDVFGTIPGREKVRDSGPQKAAILSGGNSIEIFPSDEEKEAGHCTILFKMRSRSIRRYDDFEYLVLNQLIADLLQTRMKNDLTKRSSLDFIFGFRNRLFNYGRPLAGLMVDIRSQGSRDLKEKFVSCLGEMHRAQRDGFSESELVAAKNKIKNDFLSDIGSIESFVRDYEDNFETGSEMVSPAVKRRFYSRIFESTTVDDVNIYFSSIDLNNNRVVGFFVDDKKYPKMVQRSEAKRWIIASKSAKKTPFVMPKDTSNHASIPLMNGKYVSSIDTAGVRVLRKSYDDSTRVSTLKLSNGVNVILKPMLRETDKVFIKVIGPIQFNQGSEMDSVSFFFGDDVVSNSGLGPYNSSNWRAFLKKKDIRFGHSVEPDRFVISGRSDYEELETMLQGVNLTFNSPKIDPNAFEDWKERKRREIEKVRNESDTLQIFQNSILKAFQFSGDFVTTERMLEMADMKRMLVLFKRNFQNSGKLTVIICGKFDSVSIVPIILKYVGTIPRFEENNIHNSGPSENRANQRQELNSFIFKGKFGGVSKIMVGFPSVSEPTIVSDFAMEILERVLLRVASDRLRSVDALSYTVNAFTVRHRYIPNYNYLLGVSFDCVSGYANQAINAVKNELVKLQSVDTQNGIFISSKSQILSEVVSRMKDPTFWVDYLSEMSLDGRDLRTVLSYPLIIDSITQSDIVRIVQRLNLSEPIIFSLSSDDIIMN
ncbi:M16 family metallopeptidase [Parachryseolinea silvisoli]|uniref:M16 family metallopeptidase n=1 Tax=Parachryseolinea silvisoli TaxID=2873601 RepID=UPI002265ED1A|nr:insulinase family protein [Parachryseolinea silvisoli]MCD9018889.1 insulinase family protein [Parachryseolinea silvisoli]